MKPNDSSTSLILEHFGFPSIPIALTAQHQGTHCHASHPSLPIAIGTKARQ
jgi:hypothetical protein